jgi:hypothetical protein
VSLHKSDEVYMEELRVYRQTLKRHDARVGNTEPEFVPHTTFETGGEPDRGSTDTRSIEIIKELFSQEAKKGWASCDQPIFTDTIHVEGFGGRALQ